MLLPFRRGYETWPQRLQALELAQKVERLQAQRQEFAYIENGLHLPISSDFNALIASQTLLEKKFGSRFLARQNCLQFTFQTLADFCKTKKCASIEDVGAEFDFALSLHFDRHFLTAGGTTRLQNSHEVRGLPSATRHWLESGLTHYLGDNLKEALRCFRETLMLEPSFHMVMFRIGLIYLNSVELVHEAHAASYFKHCADVAMLKEDPPMAAQAYLHAAFATYLLTKDHEALQLVKKAIDLNSSLAEAYYMAAKIASSDSTAALIKLQTAVMLDQNYLLKISADVDLEPIQFPLFSLLHQQALDRATIRYNQLEQDQELIIKIERSIKEKEIAIGQAGAHRQLFDQIRRRFNELQEIYHRNTFFDLKEFTDRYDHETLNGRQKSFSDAIRQRYTTLQAISKEYVVIEKDIESFSTYRKFAKLAACLTINVAFFYSVIQLFSLFDLAADWLVLVPAVSTLLFLIAYADLFFDRMDRLLFGLKIKWLRPRQQSILRAGIERFVHDRFETIYNLLNAALALSGIAFWLGAGIDKPPFFLFLCIGILYLLIRTYRKYRLLTDARLAAKRKFDQDISTLINSELR